MKHRLHILTVSALVFAALFCMTACGEPPVPRAGLAGKILLITLDTTRLDHMGCFGGETKTPNFDSFARGAVLFENCISTTNRTLPSHASILSSLYLKDHHVQDNKNTLPDDPRLMPRVLQAAGMKTAAFTSMGLLSEGTGFGQGFTRFDSPYMNSRSSGETNEAAFGWLEENRDEDFFVWLHYYDPHIPYDPPPPYDTMYNYTSSVRLDSAEVRPGMTGPLEEYFRRSKDPEYFRNMYKGEMSYMDARFGELMDKLRALGIYDDCLIVVVADHGESLGEHGQFWSHRSMYDETIRVPMMVKLNGGGATGPRTQLVSSVDIYPTVMELAGVDISFPIRGKSLAGIISDETTPGVRDEAFFQWPQGVALGVRTGEYSYIRLMYAPREGETGENDPGGRFAEYSKLPGSAEQQELYDNREDVSQTRNIAGLMPDETGYMKALTDAYMHEERISVAAPRTLNDENTAEKLRSLGYIQ